MSVQPAILDRPCDACPVFIGARAQSQKRRVDQFNRDQLIPIGLSGVGQIDELARSLVGISKGAISGGSSMFSLSMAASLACRAFGVATAGEFGHSPSNCGIERVGKLSCSLGLKIPVA